MISSRKCASVLPIQPDTDEPCPRFYRYQDLIRRMEAQKFTVECPDSFTGVSVPTLLYGIHASTEPQVVAGIEGMARELKEGQLFVPMTTNSTCLTPTLPSNLKRIRFDPISRR